MGGEKMAVKVWDFWICVLPILKFRMNSLVGFDLAVQVLNGSLHQFTLIGAATV